MTDVDGPLADFGVDAARAYIATVRWNFAKTMPDWPHEYTVKDWQPELSFAFEAFCRLIKAEGFVAPWPPASARPIYRNHYLVIDGWKYWAMGTNGDLGPVEDLTVINRADSYGAVPVMAFLGACRSWSPLAHVPCVWSNAVPSRSRRGPEWHRTF